MDFKIYETTNKLTEYNLGTNMILSIFIINVCFYIIALKLNIFKNNLAKICA